MINALFISLNDPLTNPDPALLSEVEAYYDHVLNHALWVLSSVIAIFGLGAPLLLNYLQRRSFDKEIVAIKRDFETQINTATTKFKKEIDQKISQSSELLYEEITKEVSLSRGLISDAVALSYLEMEDYGWAFKFTIIGIEYYLEGQGEGYDNTLRNIDYMIDQILPELSIGQIEEILKSEDLTIKGWFKSLREADPENKIKSAIDWLEEEFRKKIEEESDKK